MADDGITPAEFARREGVSRTLVVRKMKSGHLPSLPGRRVSASLVGTAWRARAPAGARPVSSVAEQPECPGWLLPAQNCQNPFDRGVLFAVLSLVRDVGALAAMAAHAEGVSIEAAKAIEQNMPTLFAERAEELMRPIGVGPYERDADPAIWPREMGLRIDWAKVE
jgi:hypothetical protein